MFISLKIRIARVVFPEPPPPLRYETRDLVIGSRIDGAVLSVIFLIDSQCLFFGQYTTFGSGPWIFSPLSRHWPGCISRIFSSFSGSDSLVITLLGWVFF